MKRIGYMRPHTYRFCVRVGAYCIRPTDVFNRKRTPCICVIHFRMYTGSMWFCGIRARIHETFVCVCTYSPRSGSFVGRMQYAPTRGRKRYVWNGIIRARLRETFVRFCTYSPRSGSFVGRIQYAPTRGRKRYAQDVVIRARLRETFVRVLLFIDI